MLFSFLTRSLGRYRRNKGLYDKLTLRCFASAWASTGAAEDLLNYALFRRDLGYSLPVRWADCLLAAFPDLSSTEQRLALGLLAELDDNYLGCIDRVSLATGLELPPVAAHLSGPDGEFSGHALIDRNQQLWRQKFADYLTFAMSSRGVAVIGNSATLRGLQLGADIDQHDLVIRFNHYMGQSALADDVGGRTDLWVVSPGYRGPLPKEVSWVVMTGPDMRYRLNDWRHVMPFVDQGVPLLTMPLPIWRGLVRVLKAPPSAGVLVLAWLYSLTNCSWQGISFAGIGTGLAKGKRYHASLARHVASERHAWVSEARQVEAWRQQGLNSVAGHLDMTL